jgi:hypothetical protein
MRASSLLPENASSLKFPESSLRKSDTNGAGGYMEKCKMKWRRLWNDRQIYNSEGNKQI